MRVTFITVPSKLMFAADYYLMHQIIPEALSELFSGPLMMEGNSNLFISVRQMEEHALIR